MDFLYIKALHIIFIVTWFAGLFYIVRIFVYQTEANTKNEPDRSILILHHKQSAKKLWYIISWPSAIITLIIGVLMLVSQPQWLQMGFMHLKLVLVLLLYGYHFSCHYVFSLLQSDQYRYSSFQLRLWNEVATLLLIAIVFLIVLKSTLSMAWGVLGFVLITLVLFFAIYKYKKIRERNHE